MSGSTCDIYPTSLLFQHGEHVGGCATAPSAGQICLAGGKHTLRRYGTHAWVDSLHVYTVCQDSSRSAQQQTMHAIHPIQHCSLCMTTMCSHQHKSCRACPRVHVTPRKAGTKEQASTSCRQFACSRISSICCMACMIQGVSAQQAAWTCVMIAVLTCAS